MKTNENFTPPSAIATGPSVPDLVERRSHEDLSIDATPSCLLRSLFQPPRGGAPTTAGATATPSHGRQVPLAQQASQNTEIFPGQAEIKQRGASPAEGAHMRSARGCRGPHSRPPRPTISPSPRVDRLTTPARSRGARRARAFGMGESLPSPMRYEVTFDLEASRSQVSAGPFEPVFVEYVESIASSSVGETPGERPRPLQGVPDPRDVWPRLRWRAHNSDDFTKHTIFRRRAPHDQVYLHDGQVLCLLLFVHDYRLDRMSSRTSLRSSRWRTSRAGCCRARAARSRRPHARPVRGARGGKAEAAECYPWLFGDATETPQGGRRR